MTILIASPEAVPFIKTGGLADAVGALLKEYKKIGIDAAIILPLYKKIKTADRDFQLQSLNKRITVPLGDSLEEGKLWKGQTPEGVTAYFIENDKFYGRDELYGTPEGDYPDNASRFIFYSRGVLEAAKVLELKVDVIHCNDWQAGLIPVYIKTIYRDRFPKTATLISIHNLGYQGLFWHFDMPLTGLGWELFNMDGLEFYGKINFLKGGLVFADIVSTVSDTYAKEILTPDFGFGLDGVLRKRGKDLYGVINGLDGDEWNPEKDSYISANYSRMDISGKTLCKKSLIKEMGLSNNNLPLIGMVSRLSAQKGLDLVADSIEKIIDGARLIVLGKGDEPFHRVFLKLKEKHKGRIAVNICFDNTMAHRIYAGSDIFLMPSMYEPCGLGQLIALRYGTIPVARKTGGLADTIVKYNRSKGDGTGFLFNGYNRREILKAIGRAIELFKDKKQWGEMVSNAMSQDFSWRTSAEKYLSLYKRALKKVG